MRAVLSIACVEDCTAVGPNAHLAEAPEDRRVQDERLVGQQQLLHRRQACHRVDGAGAALFAQRRPYALELPREFVAGVENALPFPRKRLPVAFVGRQDSLGQRQHLGVLPGGLLVLNGLQALRGPLAVVRRLDGLAGQGIVGAGRDGSVQQNVCLDDQVVVGRGLRKRCLDREVRKDDVRPAGQGRRIGGFSILLPKGAQALRWRH